MFIFRFLRKDQLEVNVQAVRYETGGMPTTPQDDRTCVRLTLKNSRCETTGIYDIYEEEDAKPDEFIAGYIMNSRGKTIDRYGR